MLFGINQIALIDRNKWNEKRYLQFMMEDIYSRHEESTFMAMTVLLHKESLCPADGAIVLDSLDENSHKHSAGVSDALKYALRESIEILGNEVIFDMKTRQGINLEENPVDASELTLECLRYMYRFLFMLFIEARPELGYAPMNEKLQRDVETAMYECRKILENKKLTGQYTSIIVDEGQDLSPSAYRLLRSLAGDEHRNDIFIVGDSHQRIYRNKAVLSKCGINVRGRSSYLRINYRTTEEIRKFAFGLLNGVSFDDLDDDYDNGKGCQSLTHGDKPEIKEFATPEEELDYLVSRIHELETAGIEQKNICIVARTHKLLDSYIAGLQRAGIKSFEIKANKTDDRTFEGVRIATMHRVKGLEFDYVFAVAVNKKVLPFGTRADFEDDISLEEFRTGEKCLLYVALTRARKSACVTCYGGLSELIV